MAEVATGRRMGWGALAFAALPALWMGAVGCGGDSGGSGTPGTAVIKASGGELTSADGLLKLTFPADAVTADTTVSVTKVAAADLPPELATIKGAGATTYKLEPSGSAFNKNVDVAITMDGMVPPDGHKTTTIPAMVAMTYNDVDGYEPIGEGYGTASQTQKILMDSAMQKVWIEGSIKHFSYLTVVQSGLGISLSPAPQSMASDQVFGSQLVFRNERTSGPDTPAYEIRDVTAVGEGVVTPMGGGPGPNPDPVRPWLTAGQFDAFGQSELVESYDYGATGEGTGGYGIRAGIRIQPSPMTDIGGMSETFGPVADEVGTRHAYGTDFQVDVEYANIDHVPGLVKARACCLPDGCKYVANENYLADCTGEGGKEPSFSSEFATCSECPVACCTSGVCTAGIQPQACAGKGFQTQTCSGVTCDDPVNDACVTPVASQLLVLFGIMQASRATVCGNIIATYIEDFIHSALGVPVKHVAGDETTVLAVGLWYLAWTQLLADTLFNNSEFDCGMGPNGYTVCPGTVQTFPAGDVVLVGTALRKPVPIADATHYYQYGFVFETDGNPANDYVADPMYPNDFFQGTDVWFEADYDPAAGWTLKKTIPSVDLTAQPTAARIIVKDNVLLLAVPASELNGNTAPDYRVTAFRHTGDYGINAPYDADGSVWPAVADGLATP